MTRQSLLRLGIQPSEIQRHTDTARQGLYSGFLQDEDRYRFLSQLRGAEQQFDLQWFQVVTESPVAEKTIGESEIRKKSGASVVGVVRNGRLVANPDASFVLEEKDMVAIIGNLENRTSFCEMASSECGLIETGGK